MPSQSLTWLLDVPQLELPEAPAEIPSSENYTDTEVAGAVNKIIEGSIRRPYGILGERKTLDAFDDTMDAAAGVFILQPAAPFYVLLLGSRRLSDDIDSAVTVAVELLDAIVGTGRRVRPVSNLTSLGNARSALLALENAVSQRENVFEDINEAPAFQRFDRHTDRFLSEAAYNIKSGEEIVQTPQQARKSLGTLVSAFTEAVQDIQRRIRLLADGIENYNSLNLPSLLAQEVIGKARGVLSERITQMEAMTPTDRLEVLREVTLDILASKAVVRGFGSLTKSGTFLPIEGFAHTFTDDTHIGTSASIVSNYTDPYIILDGSDSLTFTVDSGPVLTLPLPQSYIAKLEGTAREPFNIQAGVNDKFEVTISNSPDIHATLTPGAARTAAQIVTDLNAAVPFGQIFQADTILIPQRFIGTVNAINTSSPNITFQKSGGSWASLDVVVGDGVIVQTGAMKQLYFLVTSRSGTSITCELQDPGGVLADEEDIVISVGEPGRYIRIGVPEGNEEESLSVSRSYLVRTDTEDSAASTLGFLPGMEIACRRSRAEEIALAINSSASASYGGVARISAEPTFIGGAVISGRTDPSDPSRIISSFFRATGDVVTPGQNAVFAVQGALSAGVAIGHRLTLRTAPTTTQVGLVGLITAVTDSTISCTLSGGTVSAGTGLDLEVGVSLTTEKDSVIRILEPSPLAGDYRVVSPSTTQPTIDTSLPLHFTTGFQPLTFEMQVGGFGLTFQSLSTKTDSQLRIEGTAADLFFDNVPVENIGSTRFVLFEKDPKILNPGDILEIYTGQYETPEYTFNIIGFELGQRLIEVDGDIPIQFIELDFANITAFPFARIRKLQRNNHDLFKAQIGLWLDLDVNQDRYYSDLNRFINPLVVNENPTLSAVNTAKVQVQSMVQALQQLQVVIANYDVAVVPEVDALVSSFLQRGADRAVDTLLEGRFTDFFSFNSEEVSYLGNALERLRDVSRLDLPVRRVQRKEVVDQELVLSEHEDPDFEFDQSDIQDVEEPDIPGSFIEIPGGNF